MTGRRAMIAVMAAAMAVAVAGCTLLARLELAALHDAFETDGRIIHRLLSQRTAQQDAVMAMLALLQPSSGDASSPLQRLAAVYPQILDVRRRDGSKTWQDAVLDAAEAESRKQRRAVTADADFANGSFRLLQAAGDSAYALRIDLRAMVPREEWPMHFDQSPVRVTLEYMNQSLPIQPGDGRSGPWHFEFRKQLAAASQPFDVVATRSAGWSDLPWLKMLAWTALTAVLAAALLLIGRQRAARRRAEELLRLGQVSRLNTLGELAAGMAHELNQPLTAILASTQAAKRLLDDESSVPAAVREAMARTVEQARRAADVVGRMRRAVERPGVAGSLQPVNLGEAVGNALYLLEPECRRLGIEAAVSGSALSVRADPVALEQIIHNLLSNALHALSEVPAAGRALSIAMQPEGETGVLSIIDSGPGIAPDVLPRIFEPFFTTRGGGLGLGLSLCESLAADMGGTLTAANATGRGALFRLSLPLAEKTS